VNISGDTGLVFAFFKTYQSILRADDRSVAYFPICPGTLPRQPNNVAKMYHRRLAFGAAVLEKELQYHGLAVCINSAYDACILCENFVKFGPVTTELTGLI